MATSEHSMVWLQHAGQSLGLLPTLGGGVAAWQIDPPDGVAALWRRWDGASEDRYTLASFAMLPWSNRISGGGFEHDGRTYPMAPNRAGEPYPIHGDGWLQPWQLAQTGPGTAVMTLESHHFGDNPYAYRATQTFSLCDGFCLLYRPPQGPAFCFEPVTHPIDAFHAGGRPGLRVLRVLRVLRKGESTSLDVRWRWRQIKPA